MTLPPDLAATIRDDPTRSHRAVVTVAAGAPPPADLVAAADLAELAPNVFGGTFTGDQLVALDADDAVEEVAPDLDVHAL